MGEKVKAYWAKAKEFLGKVSKKVWIALGAVLAVAIIAVAWIVAVNSEYTVLFSELNSDDVKTIVTYLEENGISDYRLEGGDTILVPKNQQAYLQMKLLMTDYNGSGNAYSFYTEQIGMLSTESEREFIKLAALEEKVRAAVCSMENVKDASVILTPGEDNTYVLDSGNKTEATASVMVTMRDGKLLSDTQAAAIRELVSSRISGLKVDSVKITDTLGNLYTADGNADISGDASALKLQLEEKYSNIIRTNVSQVLVPLFGVDNVKITVSCTVDVNHTTEAATDVYLPEWSTNGEGIIGSKVYDNYIIRNEDGTAGGVTGTATNSDLPTYVEEEIEPDGSEEEVGASGQVDYDNPRKETYTERTAGYLTDCMVSVSINAAQASGLDADALRLHVARAAGISDEYAANKISIYTGSFYVAPVIDEPVTGFVVEEWMLFAAAGALILFLLLIIIISISASRRKKKKKKMEQMAAMQQPGIEQMLAPVEEPEPLGADVMNLKNEKSMELRKDIRKFADDNPEIAAQVVRNLLRGGENDG